MLGSDCQLRMVFKVVLIFAVCLMLVVTVHLSSSMLMQGRVRKADKRRNQVKAIVIFREHIDNQPGHNPLLQTVLKQFLCRISIGLFEFVLIKKTKNFTLRKFWAKYWKWNREPCANVVQRPIVVLSREALCYHS